MKAQDNKLKIFYDGACHLCSREVESYLKVDKAGKLAPIDIAGPDFDPKADGIDEKRANKYFHVKNGKGEILEGVEAFAAIWDSLGILKPLSWFSKTTVGKITMGASYKIFAEIRPYLPKRKGCETCKL